MPEEIYAVVGRRLCDSAAYCTEKGLSHRVAVSRVSVKRGVLNRLPDSARVIVLDGVELEGLSRFNVERADSSPGYRDSSASAAGYKRLGG